MDTNVTVRSVMNYFSDTILFSDDEAFDVIFHPRSIDSFSPLLYLSIT